MVDRAGGALPVPVAAKHPGTTAIRGVQPMDAFVVGAPLAGGPYTDNRENPFTTTTTHTGTRLQSFAEDFYNNVYVEPPVVDVGSVTSPLTVPFVIWSAFLENRLFENIYDLPQQGVRVSGVQTPIAVAPLATITANLLVDARGSPQIDGVVRFVFGDKDGRLPVKGFRSVEFPFDPNWASPYEIELSYRTDIKRSRDGTEQRRALRTKPRRRFQFQANPIGDDLRSAHRTLQSTGANIIVLPELVRSYAPMQAQSFGSTTVVAPNPPDWLSSGALVVARFGRQKETRIVERVADNTVTFTSGARKSFPVGYSLHPGVSVRLDETLRSRLLTDRVGQLTVVVDADPALDDPGTIEDAPRTFDGRELWLGRSNWSDVPDITFDQSRETVDYGVGAISVFEPVAWASRRTSRTFSGVSRVEAHSIVDFFRRCRGRQTAFWVPTWTDDLSVSTYGIAGNNSITFEGGDVYETYKDDPTHRAIFVQRYDGSVEAQKITSMNLSVALGQENTVAVLGGGWSQDDSVETVRRVSWLHLCRMSSDKLTVRWPTNTVAEVKMVWETLPVPSS